MSESDSHRVHMKRTGLTRLWWATRHSVSGLCQAWSEPAFRLELLLSAVMLPLSFWLGSDWTQVALLAGSVVFVLMAEMINTAVEAVVDMVSDEWHSLAKRAKDTASAAVFLAMLWCGGGWISALGAAGGLW